MKFFAAALIAALAYGQDIAPAAEPVVIEEPVYQEPTPMEKFESLFEVNEETGRVEFKDMPELPQISFADVNDEEIMAWAAGKQAESDAWNQEWMAAIEAYDTAIAAPFNKLVDEAESLIVSGTLADTKTDDEVISFIADNTFVDGVALSSMFPEIEEFIQGMYAQQEQMSGELAQALDHIKYPVSMSKSFKPFEEQQGECIAYDMSAGPMDGVCIEWYTYPRSDAEQKFLDFVDQLGEAVISYGYNPEVVDAWFQETGASWEELERKQRHEKATQAQQNISEARDYAMNILDNAWTDLSAKHDENKAAMEEAVGAKIVETKAMLEEKSNEARSQVDQWLLTNSNDTVTDIVEEAVVLASEGVQADNSSAYSFAAFSAVALAAAGVYLYGKKNVAKEVAVSKQSLLTVDDEEFQQC